MKHQKGFTLTELLYVIFLVIFVGSWVGNLFKLIDCDFEPSYKEEVIHGIGIIPVVSLVTVWYDKEEK